MNRKLAVILSGLSIRLALAPFTGHPYDMGVFAFSQRVWFDSGVVDLKTFPTLPLLYFIQLPFYAIYSSLITSGLPDYQFVYHTTLMIESVFLKIPYILADAGIFLLIQRITNKLWPATLFFLNPLVILLSSAWGMYDSLMLVALMFGLWSLMLGDETKSSVMLLVSGSLKLFGFLPYGLLLLGNLAARHFKKLAAQLATGILVIGGLVTLIAIFGGFYIFLVSFIFRFAGLSGSAFGRAGAAGTGSIVYLMFPSLKTIPFTALFVIATVSLFFALEQRRRPGVTTLVKWSLVGAVLLSILSQAEPQWFSWAIPLAITYGSLTKRTGLQVYTYLYGTFSTFLITTQSQAGGFIVLGTKTFFLPFVEAYRNILFVYAATTFTLLLLMLVYTLHKPMKFRYETIAIVILVYLQAYFWFSIVNVPHIIGVA